MADSNQNSTTRKKDVFFTFLETSSVKGLPKIARSPSNALRCMWVIAVLCGAGMAAFQLYQLMNLFFAYDTVARLTDLPEGAPFPDITVCNLVPSSSKDAGKDMQSYMDRVNDQLDKLYNNNDDIYDVDTYYMVENHLKTMRGYVETAGSNENYLKERSENFIQECRWRKHRLARGANYTSQIDCKHQVRWDFIPRYGRCATFTANDTLLRGGGSDNVDHYQVTGLAGIFFLNDFSKINLFEVGPEFYTGQGRGMAVAIHEAGSLPDISSTWISVPPGYHTGVELRATKRQRLQLPYGNCTHKKYLSGASGRSSANHSEYTYTQGGCESACRQQSTIVQCNCLDYHHVTTAQDRKEVAFCGRLEKNFTETIERIVCINKMKAGYESECHRGCSARCSEFEYSYNVFQIPWPHESYQATFFDMYIKERLDKNIREFDVYNPIINDMYMENRTEAFRLLRNMDLIRRNFVHLTVFFQKNYATFYEDKAAIASETLLANVGGAANLWIGITFFTIFEIVEFFYIMLSERCKKTCDVAASENHVSKEKPRKITIKPKADALNSPPPPYYLNWD